jgi:hypothetical protein
MNHGCQMVSFQTTNPKFWYILEGLRLENVDIFYSHLEYFYGRLKFLELFGTFCVHLVHLSSLGIMYQEKKLNSLNQEPIKRFKTTTPAL